MSIEAMKQVLVFLEHLTSHSWTLQDQNKAIELQRQAIEGQAQKQEPVAWNETRSKVIKALAAIVTVHTPDNLFDLDAIPREPVMHLVQQIKVAMYEYKPPPRQPFEGVIDVQHIGYHSLQLIFRSQTDIAKFKAAYGIKGEA